jgi:hypothetical protein
VQTHFFLRTVVCVSACACNSACLCMCLSLRGKEERERQFSNSKTEERNGRRENSEGTEEERKTLPVHRKMPVGLEIITEKPL